MHVIGIIPARYGATRLPGKPLALIKGRPLIEHVWRQARKAGSLNRLIVATDDERIKSAVEAFGGEAVLTPVECVSGTDRIAKVVERIPCDVVVNIQGDEPFLIPQYLDKVVSPFQADRHLLMATLAAPLPAKDLHNPNAVKVVTDREGYALYFSRAPIPFPREDDQARKADHAKLHLGIYAYHRSVLLRFAQMPRTPLEQTEKLEQLRALEHGIRIKVVPVRRATLSVDTPEDLTSAMELMEKRRGYTSGGASSLSEAG